MEIALNGQPHVVAQGVTVAQLLQSLGYHQRRLAIEVNEEVIPRSHHLAHQLENGDRVEIVHAVGGG